MFQRLVITAALAVFSATPPAAHSQTLSWRDAMTQAGVAVHHSDNCPPQAAALYAINSRSITICSAALRNHSTFSRAITHEAVHAAQHCLGIKAGLKTLLPISFAMHRIGATELGNRLYAMTKAATADGPLRQRVLGSVATGHSTDTQPMHELLEEEAYAFQDSPTGVQGMLLAACRGL